MFFSPGTRSIVATTVAVPFDGDDLSVTLQVAGLPAIVCATVVWPLSLEPETVTLQTTLVSLLVPLLVKLSVKVGAGLAGIVFGDPVCSVVPLTLTELSS